MSRLFFFISFLSLACSAFAEMPGNVWLVSNGFHSALVLRQSDIPFRREISGDTRAKLLMFGWGDADFYRRRINPWTVVKAICWPNRSIVHVVPVRGSVAARFPHSEVVELSLSKTQLRELAKEISSAFARDPLGKPCYFAPGYFPESRFYQGTERFYFPKMCNVWVAQKLRRSGVPISAATSVAASELMWQARKLGKHQQPLRRPLDAF